MNFGYIGIVASLALAAVGSALGSGKAAMATIGGWKKCFAQNKPAPFMLMAFVGMPLTQTIYGFILMRKLAAMTDSDPWMLLAAGVLGGIAMGFSALFQGKAGAAGSDAFSETGKGFAQYMIVVGLIETVALFAMIFIMITLV